MPSVTRAVELVGRGPECATVDRALAAAGDGEPSVLLVGGDAGIGKSALVAYAATQARERGYHVLEGACLDIGTSIPFGPVLEAVRPLLQGAEDGTHGGATAAVAAMFSGVGGRLQISPGHALEALRQMVAAAATSAPVLFVLEDMHWAEPSTRDFALALTRQVDGPLVVMVTFRSDDLHRRHPFRPCLLDMTRSGRSQRIDLEPLDRDGLADLVDLKTGAPASPAAVGALLARSEGNPLYAEELLARPAGSSGLPDRLADLLLARVDALSEPSRRLLRTASVNGSRLDAETLAVVSGLTSARFEAALHEAIDRNLVTQRSGHLDLWHGLLREVLYDDLLPGERTRLHAAFGQALQDQVQAGGREATIAQAGQIAYHWYAAHDLPRAFAASVLAGRLAGVSTARRKPSRTWTGLWSCGTRSPTRAPSPGSSNRTCCGWPRRRPTRARTRTAASPSSTRRSACCAPTTTPCWQVASTRHAATSAGPGVTRRASGWPLSGPSHWPRAPPRWSWPARWASCRGSCSNVMSSSRRWRSAVGPWPSPRRSAAGPARPWPGSPSGWRRCSPASSRRASPWSTRRSSRPSARAGWPTR